VFAETGQRVLLVDSDLRRPVQHRMFRVSNARGLSDVILDSSSAALRHIQRTDIENLHILTAGDIPPNPSELLASDRMGSLIEELKGRYDLVLFDSPPSLVVADGAILGSRVDGVLLIADTGQTHRKAVERVASELRRARATLLGVVLNRAQSLSTGYGYGYGYYYRYDYRQNSEETEAQRPTRQSRKLRRHKSRGRTWSVGVPGLIDGHSDGVTMAAAEPASESDAVPPVA
jgi:capsular exopolysaccharide synthesis family protein